MKFDTFFTNGKYLMVTHFIISLLLALGPPLKQFSLVHPTSLTAHLGDTARKPIVSIEESRIDSMSLLVIKDTVGSYDSLQLKLGKDYSQIFSFVFQQGLHPGKTLATYFSFANPVAFETAVEVNRFPERALGRIEFKKTEAGKVVIAHYQGPYSQVSMAYDAIRNFMKVSGEEPIDHPFEVYLNNPSLVKDPFDLKTDLYQRLR
jgi:effector-binding domain-containing protein